MEEKQGTYLNLVMEYVPETLSKVVKSNYANKTYLPNNLVKTYAKALLLALQYLHVCLPFIQKKNICHRDIKPSNILINNITAKLCDFGSAKVLAAGQKNIAYICSRYYRAPELIFGATDYSAAIDVWSTGCVIAELLLGQPLFPGESGVDQLVEIIKVLGTPTREQIHSMNPNYSEFKFPQIKAHPWSKVFRSRTPPDAIDMISKILVYNPENRPRPLEILLHPFFDELRDKSTKLPNGNNLPDLFEFTKEEISTYPKEVTEKLVPSWYTKK